MKANDCHRAEEALRKSERICTSTFEAIRDVVCLIDPEGRILKYNQATRRLLGKFAAELRGRSLCELVHGSARHPADCPVARMKKTKRRETAVVQLGRRCLEITADPVLDERQQLLGAIHVISDISAQKRAEESIALLRTWIDRSNDAMEVLDPKTGCLLDVNEKGCAALGYSREEYLSLSATDVDPLLDAPSFLKSMAKLRSLGSLTRRSRRRRKDGTTFPVEVGLIYLRLDRGYVVAVIRDITGRQRADEALPETAELAHFANPMPSTAEWAGSEPLPISKSGNIVGT